MYGRTDNGLVPRQSTGFTTFPEAEALRASLVAQLSPNWWETLSLPERDFLVKRLNTGGLPYEAGTPDPYDLRDNGMRFVDWNISGVETAFN